MKSADIQIWYLHYTLTLCTLYKKRMKTVRMVVLQRHTPTKKFAEIWVHTLRSIYILSAFMLERGLFPIKFKTGFREGESAKRSTPRLVNLEVHLPAASCCGQHSSWCRVRSSVHCGERTRVERDRCSNSKIDSLWVSRSASERETKRRNHMNGDCAGSRNTRNTGVTRHYSFYYFIVIYKVKLTQYTQRRHTGGVERYSVVHSWRMVTYQLHTPATSPSSLWKFLSLCHNLFFSLDSNGHS
jgi:hypothetical protein